MNEEIKKLWVEKLRSGEYEQGTHMLRYEDQDAKKGFRYCCLGVLCDIYAEKHGKAFMGVVLLDPGRQVHTLRTDQLPTVVEQWAEFSRGYNSYKEYASMNDMGNSFEEIADAIEEQL